MSAQFLPLWMLLRSIVVLFLYALIHSLSLACLRWASRHGAFHRLSAPRTLYGTHCSTFWIIFRLQCLRTAWAAQAAEFGSSLSHLPLTLADAVDLPPRAVFLARASPITWGED
eukprot:4692824-Amphidinium_carterae.2